MTDIGRTLVDIEQPEARQIVGTTPRYSFIRGEADVCCFNRFKKCLPILIRQGRERDIHHDHPAGKPHGEKQTQANSQPPMYTDQ